MGKKDEYSSLACVVLVLLGSCSSRGVQRFSATDGVSDRWETQDLRREVEGRRRSPPALHETPASFVDLEIAIGNKLRDFSIIKDILYISPLLLAYVCARLFNRHPPTRDPQRHERRASYGLADVTLNVHWHGKTQFFPRKGRGLGSEEKLSYQSKSALATRRWRLLRSRE